MSMEIEAAIKNLTGSNKGDHCALVRSSCAFMVHVCQDEHRLFYQFFKKPTYQLTWVASICITLNWESCLSQKMIDIFLDLIWKEFVQFCMIHYDRTLFTSIIWKHWPRFVAFCELKCLMNTLHITVNWFCRFICTQRPIAIVMKITMRHWICLFTADSLEAFGKICLQLLQDVQERLVFRAHLYLQSDIMNYKPSGGDLAYPEKLEMMEVTRIHLK